MFEQAKNEQQPTKSAVVGRLAPTPSGYLHLGNAVNFVLTWLLVRRAGGTLHLRIDDLDRARLRRAYLDNIFKTIEWLGLDYDHGPSGPTIFCGTTRSCCSCPPTTRCCGGWPCGPVLFMAARARAPAARQLR
ncbi:glutamate--tRNA ligase family protein [Hymenobacter sp. BRD67]|uniref:glutamate--tRNA ligase family protein n=1 Tax=Hymenobacter sp. BRD67 TaxID=2675877 RepID=UPI0015661168|nr:glutamate--tRNA ligase family protein [Hymenobacter sp. BRD67]QKG53163.1 hypothetical protein GKZ67_11870 [Hymenobacter sp. BRD67]